jgi:hypothetical protein
MIHLRLASATLLLIGASAVVSAADDVASDYWVRVMPSAWFVGFDGNAKYTAGGTTGDKLSLDDVDLANQEAGFGLEVSAKLPILFSFHAGGFVVGTEGSFDAGGGVDFGGETLFNNTKSSLDVSDLYAEADLQLLDLDLVGFAIGVGYHLMSTEMKLSDATTNVSLDEDFQFPVVALRGHANLPFLTSLGAEAKVHWMNLSLNDTSVGYLDATLQITWRPWGMLGFIGGYRYVAADIGFDNPAGSNADADLDITLAGPFLGLTAQF